LWGDGSSPDMRTNEKMSRPKTENVDVKSKFRDEIDDSRTLEGWKS